MALALLIMLASCPRGVAAGAGPEASATAKAVTVSAAEQAVSVALATGKLTLTSPYGERHLNVSILQGRG